MMKERRRKGQLNREHRRDANAGFSLVELLIAVTILAIIVIPLLHMFVTSTKINVKSRQTLRATTVAQDIMEGLKAYTLEEVSAQFAPPEGMSGDTFHYPADGFYIVNSSMIQGGVRDLTEVMAEYEGVYYFGIENLKMQGNEYDALIRLDAYPYGETKDTEPANYPYADYVPHDNEFNGKFYAEIGSVAETNGGGDEEAMKTDSSYHENKKLAEAVMKSAKEQFDNMITTPDESGNAGTLPDDWDEWWADKTIEDIVTKRTINVVIDDAGAKDALGNEQCKATINFTYECKYAPMNLTCTTSGYAGSESGEVINITRTFSSGNFYLFYYPLYNSVKDEIQFEVKNASKLCDEANPLLKSITLVKQIRSVVDVDANVIAPDLTDNELWAKERGYRALATIRVDTPINSELIFKSNIISNMSDRAKDPDTGERDDIDNVTRGANDSHIIICKMEGDTASEKVTNIIYDAEITVYQTGAAKHFTESNFEDNDEVHRLATITNMSQ